MIRGKRGRENPCHICGHYHKYEEGETCGICGHRPLTAAEKSPPPSAFPSEILPEFLFLGSYDNASRAELLKAFGIKHILNTVPTCQNLYRNSFNYHTVSEQIPPLGECIEFIEEVRLQNSRVMVHCMSGVNRSPMVVVAYLMAKAGMRLADSLAWVKERRDVVSVSETGMQQLREFEAELYPLGSAGPVPVIQMGGHQQQQGGLFGGLAAGASGGPGPAGAGEGQAFPFGLQPQAAAAAPWPQAAAQQPWQAPQGPPQGFGAFAAGAPPGGTFTFGAGHPPQPALPQQQQQQQPGGGGGDMES